MGEIIRKLHGCEVRIENSVPRVTVTLGFFFFLEEKMKRRQFTRKSLFLIRFFGSQILFCDIKK